MNKYNIQQNAVNGNRGEPDTPTSTLDYTAIFILTIPLRIYLPFILLLACSFIIAYVLYRAYQMDNIFAFFVYVTFGGLWLYFFILLANSPYKAYSKEQRVYFLLSLVISVLSLTPVVLIYNHFQTLIDKPTLLKAQRHGVYADFKTDHTYSIRSGQWAGRVHVYGHYTLRDSIITIDIAPISHVLVTPYFLIKKSNAEQEKRRPENQRIYTSFYLVQLDSNGAVFKGDYVIDGVYIPYRFEVVEDNR